MNYLANTLRTSKVCILVDKRYHLLGFDRNSEWLEKSKPAHAKRCATQLARWESEMTDEEKRM